LSLDRKLPLVEVAPPNSNFALNEAEVQDRTSSSFTGSSVEFIKYKGYHPVSLCGVPHINWVLPGGQGPGPITPGEGIDGEDCELLYWIGIDAMGCVISIVKLFMKTCEFIY